MISVFLNTRQRPLLLHSLINSLISKTSNINNVELLIRYDSDDKDTHHLLTTLSYSFIKPIIGPRPDNLHIAINQTVSQTKGDFLFVLNDDVLFITPDWDKQLESIDSSQAWYLSTQDNSCDKVSHKKYSSFPILTRAAYESLGYFMSDRLVGLGGDVHLWRIFNEIGRIKSVNIELDHVLHRTVQDVVNPDGVAMRMREHTKNNFIDPWTMDIGVEIEKISSCL